MLKTSNTKSAKPKKGVVGAGCGKKAGFDRGKLDESEMDDVEVDSGKVRDNKIGKKGQQSSKNLSKSKKTTRSDFLTLGARLVFTKLRQVFVKAPILYHFDLEHHIWVETDASSYIISRVLSQLTSDDLGRWHSIAFFSQKMIPAGTRYKTHDGKLLAIVEPFKT